MSQYLRKTEREGSTGSRQLESCWSRAIKTQEPQNLQLFLHIRCTTVTCIANLERCCRRAFINVRIRALDATSPTRPLPNKHLVVEQMATCESAASSVDGALRRVQHHLRSTDDKLKAPCAELEVPFTELAEAWSMLEPLLISFQDVHAPSILGLKRQPPFLPITSRPNSGRYGGCYAQDCNREQHAISGLRLKLRSSNWATRRLLRLRFGRQGISVNSDSSALPC